MSRPPDPYSFTHHSKKSDWHFTWKVRGFTTRHPPMCFLQPTYIFEWQCVAVYDDK
jgi:hypothetical protein